MSVYQLYPNIKKHPIFENAPPQAVDRYLDNAVLSCADFTNDEILYSSESHQEKIGIILKGSAEIHTGLSGEQVLLNTICEGEMFGIANLYAEDEPFPTVITAKEFCRVLFIERQAICRLIENDPVITKNFLKLQSRKIMYLNKKILTFTAGSAERKLSVFLCAHAQNGIFTPSCSMSALASMLGIGRASLYRSLDRLVECGWIRREGKSIHILNQDALAELI